MDKKVTLKEFFEGTMPTWFSKAFYEVYSIWCDGEVIAQIVNCRCKDTFKTEYFKQDKEMKYE
jgi:hypothetical protein